MGADKFQSRIMNSPYMQDRHIRKESYKEIMGALFTNGIIDLEGSFSSKRITNCGLAEVNRARIQVEDLKKEQKKYDIEVKTVPVLEHLIFNRRGVGNWMKSYSGAAPEGYFFVGTAIDPNYGENIQEFDEVFKDLNILDEEHDRTADYVRSRHAQHRDEWVDNIVKYMNQCGTKYVEQPTPFTDDAWLTALKKLSGDILL